MFFQDVAYNGAYGGTFSILLYETPKQAMDAYESYYSAYAFGMSEESLREVSDLGDRAFGISLSDASVSFVRCNAFVSAHTKGEFNNPTTIYSGLLDYAKSLDKRLSEVDCR
jgi:hypothetical protein